MAGSAPVGVIAVQVLSVVFGLVIIGLMVWAGTWLGRYLMDATPTPDGDTVANRMLGHSPGDYAPNRRCWPSVAASPGIPRPCQGGCAAWRRPPAPPWRSGW